MNKYQFLQLLVFLIVELSESAELYLRCLCLSARKPEVQVRIFCSFMALDK